MEEFLEDKILCPKLAIFEGEKPKLLFFAPTLSLVKLRYYVNIQCWSKIKLVEVNVKK